MPLSSVAGVGVSPHVDTCQTSHHDSAKKKQSPQPETNSEYVHVSGFAGAVHALEKIQKKQFHLPQIAPISFILPQLCAHGAFKIIKQL